MEGLGQGYEAFVERLQMNFAASAASQSSIQSDSHGPFPEFHLFQAYQSPTNAFAVKREGSAAISDVSANSQNSVCVEVSMHEAVNSPSPPGLARPPSPARNFTSDDPKLRAPPVRRGGHRRAQSEIAFRVPDDFLFDLELGPDSGISTLPDDLGEDLLSAYLEMENGVSGEAFNPGTLPINGNPATKPSHHHSRSFSVDEIFAELATGSNRPSVGGWNGSTGVQRRRHQHSISMDGSGSFAEDLLTNDLDTLETKKTEAASKLAELSQLDPKRAKRILANRQSAARSKERKMRYISELERRVQTLQTEATSLSTQLTTLQRDGTGLSTENNELKLRLQSMEQQSHLRDALSETLKEEIQHLKLAAVQMGAGNGQGFSADTCHLPLSQALFQNPLPSQPQTTSQLQQVQTFRSNHPRSAQPPAHLGFTQHSHQV